MSILADMARPRACYRVEYLADGVPGVVHVIHATGDEAAEFVECTVNPRAIEIQIMDTRLDAPSKTQDPDITGWPGDKPRVEGRRMSGGY